MLSFQEFCESVHVHNIRSEQLDSTKKDIIDWFKSNPLSSNEHIIKVDGEVKYHLSPQSNKRKLFLWDKLSREAVATINR